MGFFKKDKSSSDAQQQQAIQQQQQLRQQLAAAQTQATQAQFTISRLRDELSEQTRLIHSYRTESANLQAELQNARSQLVDTQNSLYAEAHQRQTIDRRLQESDLAHTILVSSLETELRSSREIAEQQSRVNETLVRENDELQNQIRLLKHEARTGPQVNGRSPSGDVSRSPVGFFSPQFIAELPVTPSQRPPQRVQVRQSQPQLRTQPPQMSPSNPFRPASAIGTRRSAHLPSTGVINNPSPTAPRSGQHMPPPYQANPANSSPAPVSSPQRQTPNFLVPPMRSTPAPIEEEEGPEPHTSTPSREGSEESEEAQHRRAILESAEISRYEDRVRAAEASREQMQAQFTALSGEVATLRKALQEKNRELFVRDNQLEWVQQRAAALVRGDGDSPFLVDL